MRNKLLALILALTMAIGLVAMTPTALAAEGVETIGSDVVAEAAELLVTLNIVQGYEDGSLGLEKNITRAEFACMLARMLQGTDELNLNAGAIVNTKMSETPENIAAVKAAGEAAANVGAKNYHTDIDSTDLADPSFSDISELHWAYNDVEYLRGQGIVTGYTDGTFKPDNNILYEEAVKFVVSALGYDFMAVTYGGYPEGYIKTANQLKILKNVGGKNGVAATRAEIMVLLFNSLTADYLVLDKINNGYNTYETDKNILNYVFGLDIIEKCYVVATENSGIDSVYHATEKGTIEIGEESDLGGTVFKIYNDEYKNYLGYRVKAYVKYDEYDPKQGEIFCMYPYAKTKTVTFKSEDIANSDVENNLLEIYVGDEDELELELAEEPDVIYNGVAYARTLTDSTFDLESGDITLVSTTGTKVYDLIYINEYIPMYVETVKSGSKTIVGTSYYGGSVHEDYTVVLDDDKEFADKREIVVDIIKADGTKGTFADIKADSVVYIRMWANHYIVNLGGTLVNGTVSRRGTGYVMVGDKKYEEIESSGILNDYKTGANLKLGVNKDGYVFYAEAQTGLSGLNYGVIMSIAIDEESKDFEDVLMIKLMDAAGKKQIYPVAENMKFTDMGKTTYRYNDEGKANSMNADEFLAMLENSAKYASMQKISTAAAYKNKARCYEQVIKYSLNAAGEIKEIVTAMPSSQVPASADKGSYFTFEDVSLTTSTVTAGNISGTPYSVGSTPLALVPADNYLYDSRYMMTKESRRGSYGFVLFDVKADGTVGFALSKNDKATGSGGKSSGNDGSYSKAFAVIEYEADTLVDFDGESYDGFEIGYIHSGAYKTVNSITGSGSSYPYRRNQGEYYTGDVVNPRLWTTGPYWWDHITETYDLVSGNLAIEGDSEKTVAMGYFPIKAILSRIIDGTADMYFRTLDNDTDGDGLGLYDKEVVFGKVVGVSNGKVLVAYGKGAHEVIACAVSGKKATSYDCETGFVSVVNATDVAEGDWALLQITKKEFKSLVIYTNTDEASLDNIQRHENERK